MAQARAFQGQLEEFGLVDLLQTMGLEGKTGALHLRSEERRLGVVYFDNGALVGAQEQDREALTLGHVLQQLQMTSQQQMDYVYQMQVRDALGKRIGERLIDQGSITAQQLERALRTQTLWTIRELALWKQGEYAFHSGERMPADAAAPRTEITAAVMEALRYLHEWETLEFVLPDGMRTALTMASEPPIDHSLQFLPAAWRVISRVNSQRTVRRIATSLRTPELDVARLVGTLVRDGLLTPRPLGGRPGLPVEAERMNLERFDLFSLLISMEQSWIKAKTEAERLITLAGCINQTMGALEDTYASSGVALAPDTLAQLLERERIHGVGDYLFSINQNRIDLQSFGEYCHSVFGAAPRAPGTDLGSLFVEYREQLKRALEAAFDAINARIVSPAERAQNREAWDALFQALDN